MLNIRSYVVMNRMTVVLECQAHWPAQPVRLWFGSRSLETGSTAECLAVLAQAAASALALHRDGCWSHDCAGAGSPR